MNFKTFHCSVEKTPLLVVLTIICLTMGNIAIAKNQKLDSLYLSLKSVTQDTEKVNILCKISSEYISQKNYRSGIDNAQKALDLATKTGFNKGQGNALYNFGKIYDDQANYAEAIKNYNQSLKIKLQISDKKGVFDSYNRLGVIYKNQGDYTTALNMYNKALKVAEDIKDKKKIATIVGNIGNVFKLQGNYKEALNHYFKALKIDEELNNKKGMARHLGNIGVIYKNIEEYSNALKYYNQALTISQQENDKEGMALHLGNIGNIHLDEKKYEKSKRYYLNALEYMEETGNIKSKNILLANLGSIYAMQGYNETAIEYYDKALKISEQSNDKKEIAHNLGNIGAMQSKMKKFESAEYNLKKAISIGKSIGHGEYIRNFERDLSVLYDSIATRFFLQRDYANATKYYKKSLIHIHEYIEAKDAVVNQDNKSELLQAEIKYEFDKKEIITKAENDKQQAIAEQKNKNQLSVITFFAIGLLIVLLFTAFTLRALRITKKQKSLIEIQKTESELQRKIIEEKNKNITDSINYAKRIQNALLREEEHVSKHLPEHFILFLPKDIVSGDFYWGAEKNEYWYFTVADCTGHGVPGAIMSMLGISFLNDIVLTEEVITPAEILNQLRNRIINELRQKDASIGNKDGMDISLCRLNLKTLELEWAGANNALNLLKNGVFEQIKADKQPIGYHSEMKPFTNHKIQLQKGDSIYIYSDGYADQFGGPKGKKFKYKQLEGLIFENHHLNATEQKEIFKNLFTKWKGSLEQVDDVCVIGVKI